MDDPTVMSVLEFHTQVGLWDCRRETAIQASKKERKKHLFTARQSRLCGNDATDATSSPAVRGIPKKPDLGAPTWRLKGLYGHQAFKLRLATGPCNSSGNMVPTPNLGLSSKTKFF